jgi:hydroxymethylglutaryl-CoA reductase (NADPH)
MTRAPVFACTSPAHAAKLKKWLKTHLDQLGHIAEETSHHLTYLDCQLFQQSNLVFARFAFDTGDAMGMNMVTHAASAIADYTISQNPGVTCPALSSNLCTDKKVSRLNHKLGRARMLTVTADLSTKLITQILKTTPKQLMLTYRSKIVHGSKLAGLSGYNTV